jgi:hypothetical protein
MVGRKGGKTTDTGKKINGGEMKSKRVHEE